jgi:L-ascorbate metabolism protein UlaG (beta-lactamase superfamily)
MRTITALLAAAWVVLPPPPALQARFIGNMAVAITDGTTTVITDFPYQSGASGYMTYPASEIRSSTAVTIALITHGHADHWAPALFERTAWKLIGPRDVASTVAADRRLDPRALAAPNLRIDPIATPHAGVGHDSYLVTWHGRRLYFTGDTESLDALVAANDLDAAFVSPWLFREALARGRTIDARRIVIYHHRAGETVPQCTGSCETPRQGDTLRF